MPEQRADAALSEDELARLMIERIARQVDLETGRVPLAIDDEDEPSVDDPAPSAVEEAAAEPVEEPEETETAAVELSDEDVSRDLVERIAREVDEESHG